MKLIKLTKLNGEIFYLNAAKILLVQPVATGSIVYHEPYNIENVLDWENVQETPEQIAALSTINPHNLASGNVLLFMDHDENG